jgi:hypothetical protein
MSAGWFQKLSICNTLEAKMSESRIEELMRTLTKDTVLGDLLEPFQKALDRVRYHSSRFASLSMRDFIGVGVLRHLQGMKTLREQNLGIIAFIHR